MKETIDNIIGLIRANSFKSEEQVKLGIVVRLLQKCGWNIWDPTEVVLEYKVSDEDNTKVDIALFHTNFSPSVYIEVKNINKADIKSLGDIERQLRNYNRDNTAPITVITDGIMWYFYLSQTGGVFSKKKFKELNVLEDTIEEIIESFNLFLRKEQIETGLAIQKANEFLNSTRIEILIGESIHEAKKLSDQPPFPSLVDVIIQILSKQGFHISREKAINGIKKARNILESIAKIKTTYSEPEQKHPTDKSKRRIGIVHIDRDLRWTEIIESYFDGKNFGSIAWNTLLRVIFTKAFSEGWSIDRIHLITGINIYNNDPKIRGYNPIGFKNYYSLDVEATKAGNNIEALCNEMKSEVRIKYKYTSGKQKDQFGQIEVKNR